jgi:hypothetical protein
MEQMYGVFPTAAPHNGIPPLPSPTSGGFGLFNNADATDHAPTQNPPISISPTLEPDPKPHRSSTQTSRSKGKSKKDDQPISRRRRSTSSPEPNWAILEPSSPESDARTPPAPRPTGSPRLPGQVFASSSGDSLSFFVQVDLTNRLSLVTKIKVCFSTTDVFISHGSYPEKQGSDSK